MNPMHWFLVPLMQEILFPMLKSQVRVGWLGVDFIAAIKSTDLVGHTCLVVLAIFSVISWAIIGYKFLHIYQATKQTDEFVDSCMGGGGSLDDAYKSAADYPDSPLAQILREAYVEVQAENWYKGDYGLDLNARVDIAKVGIERVMERTISGEISHLESYLIFLATTANVCPFIGLFGTVWGILGCFQSLGGAATSAVQALGPGIATALTTTVAGLVAAIPAVICYNYLTSKIQVLISRMDSFALELSNVIQKQLLKRG
jgi:biopolymer transport protein TolQ